VAKLTDSEQVLLFGKKESIFLAGGVLFRENMVEWVVFVRTRDSSLSFLLSGTLGVRSLRDISFEGDR